MDIDWRQVRREMLLGLCVWGSLGVFFYSRSYLGVAFSTERDYRWGEIWWRAGIETGLDVLLWTLFTPVILGLARRFPLKRGVMGSHLAVHVAAGVLLASASTLFNFWVATYTFLVGPFWPRFYFVSIHANLLSYAAAVAAEHALDFYRRYRDRELKTSQLETQLARAHLRALEMQIHPHFLFNTLNSISELVHHDPDAAEVMIAQLGDLLRMTTDGAGAQEVPLRRELAFVNTYLQIEQTRFQDRLTVHTAVEPEALDALIPTLLLQPLVENAIRHGLAPQAKPGSVTIKAARDGARLLITIRDDGVGLPREGERRERVGIGNTRTRLQQAYGAHHRFEMEDAPGGGTLVTIEIPFMKAEAGDAPSPAPRPTLAGAGA